MEKYNIKTTALTNQPLVSIVIPTFNRANLIEETILSVLKQTYKNVEIIIIDDGSTDNTDEVIKKIKDGKIVYKKLNKNQGAAKARNLGAAIASGDYLAFLDSDDIWAPEKIQKQLSVLLGSTHNIGAVYCGMELLNKTDNKIFKRVLVPNIFYQNFTEGKYFLTPQTSTILFKKKAFFSIGGFDDNLPAHQDTEIAIRFCQYYSYELINEYLVRVARYHEQMMDNVRNFILAKEIIIKKHFDFLSPDILFNLCKQVSNYYILSKSRKKAIVYLSTSLKIKPFNITTKILLYSLIILPNLLYKFYSFKYKNIPNSSGI